MSYDAERAAIIEVGRLLDLKDLVTATEGNISMRVADGHLVTASGINKGSMRAEHVILIDHEGRRATEGPAITSEAMMHAAIYRLRPDVHAIVHAHPPTATAFAVAHVQLDERILAESVLVLGSVPLIPYATPGTEELANLVAESLRQGHAALLANHGAITVGKTLAQAHQRMETLEHVARVAFMARLLGGARQLPAADIERLLGMKSGPYR